MRSLAFLGRAVVLPLALALAVAAPVAAAPATSTSALGASTVPATVVSGTGTLAARGAGYVRLAGSYVVRGSMDGGWLKISGVSRWTIIRVSSWVSRTRLADGSILFKGVHGPFVVAGRSIVTQLRSPAVRFTVAGHGRTYLLGSGINYVNGHGPFRWTITGANATF